MGLAFQEVTPCDERGIAVEPEGGLACFAELPQCQLVATVVKIDVAQGELEPAIGVVILLVCGFLGCNGIGECVFIVAVLVLVDAFAEISTREQGACPMVFIVRDELVGKGIRLEREWFLQVSLTAK